jgi:hypothetical protein
MEAAGKPILGSAPRKNLQRQRKGAGMWSANGRKKVPFPSIDGGKFRCRPKRYRFRQVKRPVPFFKGRFKKKD